MLSLLIVGGPKIGWSPRTPDSRTNARKQKRRGKESPKFCTRFKSCEPLYTCPRAPFIGRRRDFYIPKLPSNLKNIPDVNMYLNILYIPWFVGLISYIYKSATSSHVKPKLLRQRLWPGPSLTPEPSFAKVANHQDPRTELQNLQPKRNSSEPPKFLTSRFPEFAKFLTSCSKN
jgi:hypothetical protein